MKIGIDIDEVVAEFVKGYLKKYTEKYEKSFDFEKIFSYNLWESLNITKEEAIKLADEFYDSEHFENIGLVSGAKESITKLSKDNELIFITSRPIKLKNITENFIKNNFKELLFRILFSNDFFQQGNLSKGEICQQENIDFLIEDNKDYSISCAEKGIKVILFDKPWNRNFEHENVTRVSGWEETLEVLKLNEFKEVKNAK